MHDHLITVEQNEGIDSMQYSSSPCYAHEFGIYDEPMERKELLVLLERLVEDIREGIRAVRHFARESKDPEVKKLFRVMALDKAWFRDKLIHHIKRHRGVLTPASASYYDQVNAITSKKDRCAYLYNLWYQLMGGIRGALPRIADSALAATLTRILSVEEQYLEQCSALLEANGGHRCDHQNSK